MHRLALTLLLAVVPFAAQADGILAHWVQLGPAGVAELRAVTDQPKCPDVVIDGTSQAMQIRAEPNGNFPRLCSMVLPRGAKTVSLIGQTQINVAVPTFAPQRIVVLGDTGCRIKGSVVQACNDPAKWPFPRVAEQAANLKPDLVIHVGDYLYRELRCPKADTASCGDSPFGDNWTTWDADFFAPAKPMLDAAPIVLVRGNHEDCPRSGPGWLRLMGPSAYNPNAACGHVAPYAVALGPMTLVVMDDANAPDEIIDRTYSDAYRGEFQNLSKLAPAPIWLALHRPIWGAVTLHGLNVGGNRTMIAALDPAMLSPVALMLSGHIHAFEALNYRGHVPPQIVAGNGGDNLDTAPPDLSGLNLSGQTVKDGISLPGFGFLLMTHREKDWRIDVYGVDGVVKRVCRFADGRVDCPAK